MNYKYPEALQSILEHHKWETTTFPLAPKIAQHYSDLLNKGCMYIHKRDKFHRPIFILRLVELSKLGVADKDLINLGCFLIQFVITRGLIPGKVENWVTIFDLKGIGLTNVPKKLLKAVTKPMQDYFKCRLYKMYVINAKWSIKIMWKLAKKLVDPLTMLKFVVTGDDFEKELLKDIDPSCLEKRYGGTCEDLSNNFFPPTLV